MFIDTFKVILCVLQFLQLHTPDLINTFSALQQWVAKMPHRERKILRDIEKERNFKSVGN